MLKRWEDAGSMLQGYRGAGREEREGGGRESRERRRRERERESEMMSAMLRRSVSDLSRPGERRERERE